MNATTKATTQNSRCRGRARRALDAVCLLTALVLGTAAHANMDGTGPDEDGDSGFAPGDLIGTLPVLIGGDSPYDAVNNPALVGKQALVQPAFSVFGDGYALEQLIDDATGSGFVTVYAQPGTGLQRLVFHGDVSISLDRSVLLRQTFETALWTGSGFGPCLGVVSYEGTAGGAFHVASDSQISLPLTAVASTDVLDTGHVTVALTNRFGDVASLSFTAHGGSVLVDQNIPD